MTEPLRVRTGGILPVDKPVGPTSHAVVGRARTALGTRKIGHSGTLDPFASGLLLLCVDAATRLSEYLTGLDKTYEATMRLGQRTDTLDPEGEIVEEDEAWKDLDEETVRQVLSGFVGEIRQVPPQYSAKKVEGEAMHRKARRGERVELDPVTLRIHSMELVETDLPRVRFRTRCSSGTYIRALARDLGAALGSCAHLLELRRTEIGRFGVEDAVALEDLGDPERVREAWISPRDALAHLPSVRVDASEARRLAQGQGVAWPASEEDVGLPEGDSVPVAVEWNDALVAVGERRGSALEPRKVFVRV